MILQMLAENTVKHGIANLIEGGEVFIETFLDNSSLHLIVRNTGKIIPAEDSTKIGLDNIAERLKLLYHSEASFTLSELNHEVEARIVISKEHLNF